MVPDEDFLRRALVNAETLASANAKSKEPPQLVHSTDGVRNHWDRVNIRAL